MTPLQQIRLQQIANRFTRYEVVLCLPDNSRRLIGYTARPGRSGLFRMLSAVAPRVLALMHLPETSRVKCSGRGKLGHVWTFDNGAAVRFSGRTERDAILAGELETLPKAEGVQREHV